MFIFRFLKGRVYRHPYMVFSFIFIFTMALSVYLFFTGGSAEPPVESRAILPDLDRTLGGDRGDNLVETPTTTELNNSMSDASK